MLNACLAGKENIFDQIKKMRKVKNKLPTCIDGNDAPANRFAEVYGELYNSASDKDETEMIFQDILASVDASSLNEVALVTPKLVENVIGEIRSNKSDPVFQFNSNCIKRSPTSFHSHMANIIKLFLIHGHVSEVLLIATIVPLLKDKQGDTQSSDNYRSIALSSVVLKIFDWVVLTLFEEQLGLDDLQFSYQKRCSTNMCTWMAVESINHFLRNGTEIYACFMDMKKAFDMVKHSTLFRKLIDKNLPPIYLRLLLVMYKAQSAKVKWNGELSDAFSISNGVKQGAVLSAVLFCIYIDDLIQELRKSREGCWVNGGYVGIIVYADDIALLSPSIDGLQNMIDKCEQYARLHNLTFSTHENPVKSKTKCMAFLKEERNLRNLHLKGKPLPWVDSVKHLGTTLTNNGGCTLKQDLLEKRAMYIARNNDLKQEFYFTHPKTRLLINNIYNTSFYGAPLWDLTSRAFEKLEKTWNVSSRVLLDLPRRTHKYFIEPVTGTPHIVKSIYSRFIRFITNIADGKKNSLKRVLAAIKTDVRSTTGKNLRYLLLKTKNFCEKEITTQNEPYQVIPINEAWRLQMINELIDAKCGDLSIILTKKEIDDLAEFICCE